ncbi:MAG TPA: hypothetical protein VFZ16_16050, partial [Hyphomicrobiaceae bacterium]|nr:hypothetical protein [Hyphomicrobiaceae bacterium]
MAALTIGKSGPEVEQGRYRVSRDRGAVGRGEQGPGGEAVVSADMEGDLFFAPLLGLRQEYHCGPGD